MRDGGWGPLLGMRRGASYGRGGKERAKHRGGEREAADRRQRLPRPATPSGPHQAWPSRPRPASSPPSRPAGTPAPPGCCSRCAWDTHGSRPPCRTLPPPASSPRQPRLAPLLPAGPEAHPPGKAAAAAAAVAAAAAAGAGAEVTEAAGAAADPPARRLQSALQRTESWPPGPGPGCGRPGPGVSGPRPPRAAAAAAPPTSGTSSVHVHTPPSWVRGELVAPAGAAYLNEGAGTRAGPGGASPSPSPSGADPRAGSRALEDAAPEMAHALGPGGSLPGELLELLKKPGLGGFASFPWLSSQKNKRELG